MAKPQGVVDTVIQVPVTMRSYVLLRMAANSLDLDWSGDGKAAAVRHLLATCPAVIEAGQEFGMSADSVLAEFNVRWGERQTEIEGDLSDDY